MTKHLTAEQMAKLARMRDCSTLYEAVIVRPDGAKCLLAYCGQHSKRGLQMALQTRGEHAVRFLGVAPDARVTVERGSQDLRITGGGIVRFSGRTKRDAIMEGELAYVGDAA